MTTFKSLLIASIIFFSAILSAQDGYVLFSLQQMPDLSWGVFIKPDNHTFPSSKLFTGTGQVTIVAPVGFEYFDQINFNGVWVENARVTSPEEAQDRVYISFGFESNNPKIELSPEMETLLFTFSTDESYKGTFHLFENGVDPFEAPNSKGCNPGNDIGMLDFSASHNILTYNYGGNYQVENKGAMAIMFSEDGDNDEK